MLDNSGQEEVCARIIVDREEVCARIMVDREEVCAG